MDASNVSNRLEEYMNKRIVGVGDMIVSNDPEDIIVTYALGSCLGVVIYDPVANVGGMLHAMLPDSTLVVKKMRPSTPISLSIPAYR